MLKGDNVSIFSKLILYKYLMYTVWQKKDASQFFKETMNKVCLTIMLF